MESLIDLGFLVFISLSALLWYFLIYEDDGRD